MIKKKNVKWYELTILMKVLEDLKELFTKESVLHNKTLW